MTGDDEIATRPTLFLRRAPGNGYCRVDHGRGIIHLMSALTTELRTLDQLLDPVRACLTPEVATRIAALRADPTTQAELDLLAEKNAEGQLTPEERAKYEALVRAGNLIAVLQAKARSVLDEVE
ncbi:MAG TPA: hypothetical protein VKA46_16740 [Gemmataceae bacterium]|nr:hypothetical protein [Gemmataceae bacterium]